MPLSPEQSAAIESLVYNIVYPDDRITRVASIATSGELQYLANFYNWDDGFGLPPAIANHPKCDLGTAVTLFWLAGPESWLSKAVVRDEYNRDWFDFCELMFERIRGGVYKKGETRYRLDAYVGLWRYQKLGLPESFWGDVHDVMEGLRAMARGGKGLNEMVDYVQKELELTKEMTVPLLAIFCQAFSLPLRVVLPLREWVTDHDDKEIAELLTHLRSRGRG